MIRPSVSLTLTGSASMHARLAEGGNHAKSSAMPRPRSLRKRAYLKVSRPWSRIYLVQRTPKPRTLPLRPVGIGGVSAAEGDGCPSIGVLLSIAAPGPPACRPVVSEPFDLGPNSAEF